MRRSRLIKWIRYQLIFHSPDFPVRLFDIGRRAIKMKPKIADKLFKELEQFRKDFPGILPDEAKAIRRLQGFVNNFKGQRKRSLAKVEHET